MTISSAVTGSPAAAGPLQGLLVVDLSRALAGPHAAMMLGDLGARVIKVEPPQGDDSRAWGPPFVSGPGGDAERVATYYLAANRNKESITLDLKDHEDAEVLRALVVRADVVVENFRPGALARLGLGHEALLALNPRLIVLSITGFGHDGPESNRPGYDQIAQGETGLMSLTGSGPDDPQRVGVPICDLLAGMNGATGVLAAVHEREWTGRGQIVRTSLLAAGISVHAFQGTRWTVASEVPHSTGNHHPTIAPYGLFRCRDGAVQVAVGSEALWTRFAPVVGLSPTDFRFASNADRVAHRDELVAAVEHAFATRDRDDLIENFRVLGIPAGRVRTLDEVYASDQIASQGLLVEVESGDADLRLPGPPLRLFDADDHETTRVVHRPPPSLDESGPRIRAWLAGEHAADRTELSLSTNPSA